MTLAEKLCHLREEKGLSQLEVSEILGVSRQTISKWEVGGSLPSTKNLFALSNLYGVGMESMADDGAQLQSAPEPCVVAVKEVQNSGPPPHTALRYILGTVCFLALCAVACVIMLTLGRPQEDRGEEGEITSISNLERGTIDLPIEGQFDIGTWESEEVYNS